MYPLVQIFQPEVNRSAYEENTPVYYWHAADAVCRQKYTLYARCSCTSVVGNVLIKARHRYECGK